MPKPLSGSGATTGSPSALVLAPEAPYPVVGGGPMRTASVLEYLRLRYRVHVVTFREPGAPDPATHFPADIAVHVIDLPTHSRSVAGRGYRNLNRAIRGVPPLIDRFSGFESQVAQFTGSQRFDLGLIEHFWCAHYADILRQVCGTLVLDLHNIESVLLGSCANAGSAVMLKPLFRRWARRCAELERSWLPRFDLVLTASSVDASRVPVRSVVYPNTIPMRPLPRKEKRTEIVFAGNMEYQPNLTAVNWFYRRVWPLVRERCPGLVWRLAGKNEHAIRRLVDGDGSIVATGPMRDSVATLAESMVSVVPVLTGSGTRIKIIESWAAGLPVVSTTLGAEGLPGIAGRDLLIADSHRDFADRVVNLLQSSEQRCQLATRGRHLYEEQLTWDSAWKVLKDIGL